MKIVKNNITLDRKTLAVLSADVYNYSKLTEENEEPTHINLRNRLKIFERIILNNYGSVNRLVGDNILATFEKVSDAIYAAAEIQAASHKDNFELSINSQLLFRIGIAYGDVIFDMNEPYGNIVNIASRLESLSEPSGIYITEYATSKLDATLPFHLAYRGKIKVKNIKEPIAVNKIILNNPISYKHPLEFKLFKNLNDRVILFATLVILFISIVLFVFSLGILHSVDAMLS
jgi:adenylate cyclase